MKDSSDLDQDKRERSRAAVNSCLAAVEAAMKDLLPEGRSVEKASVVDGDAYRQRLENRIHTAVLCLHRLEDATRRLFKRLGMDTRVVDSALRSSVSIRVANRLADSWKHGLGGQAKNATLLNGVLSVRRADGFRDASGDEQVHVLGMLVTDAVDGTFASGTLLSAAVRDWAAVLQPAMNESIAWADRVCARPEGPIVVVPEGVTPSIPLGATVEFELPRQLRNEMTAEAKKRSESA